MDFWKIILSKLETGINIYLLSVIKNTASSPGRQGFKMLVASDGFLSGSIGGGQMEFNLVEQAKKLLQSNKMEVIFRQLVHRSNSKNSSGLICSGEQIVVFYPLDSKNISTIRNVIECFKSKVNGILQLSPDVLKFKYGKIPKKYAVKIENTENWLYQEQIGYKDKLYIVGAGHVGLACSQLFRNLEFYVHIFDNRVGLNTFDSNKYVHKKQIIDYAEICNFLKEGESSYILVMTSSSEDDKLILRQLLRKRYKYIGLLAGKSKLKNLLKQLLKAGFTPEELSKIHSPIGLPINSRTPHEIAVSIAAEIIKIKNQE